MSGNSSSSRYASGLDLPGNDCFVLFLTGEICAFKIHGQEMPFEAVVLNKTSGEGRLRAKRPIDCELQKEYTFIIQAYDCGSGPSGTNWKKSHKWVKMRRYFLFVLAYVYSTEQVRLKGSFLYCSQVESR